MATTPTTPTKETPATTPATQTQAQIDARVAMLARLSGHAAFIIGGKVLDFKHARGVSGTFLPTTQQKTEKQWKEEIADLTPKEIAKVDSLINVYKDPAKTKKVEDLSKKPITFAEWADERSKMTEDEIFAIEAETQGLVKVTPSKEIVPQTERGKAFAKWAEERSMMTEDEIFEIEAETQGLKEVKPEKEFIPQTEAGRAFAAWAEERGKMTEDEIFDIEAETQGLTLVKQPKIPRKDAAQLKSEYEADLAELDTESITDLQDLEDELNQQKEQFLEEHAADVAELEQEDPEELQRLEEELNASTESETGTRALKILKQEGGLQRKQPTVPEKIIIKLTEYPKWWKNGGVAPIDLTAPGSQVIIKSPSKGFIFIAAIVLTVTEATAITIKFGEGGASGPIYLGDGDQPKGMVIAMGNSPAPCGKGGLSITATDINSTTPSIGGFATYYIEPV